MKKIQTFPSEAGDVAQLAKAFSVAVSLARSSGKRLTLFVPTLRRIIEPGLTEVLGKEFLTKLLSRGSFSSDSLSIILQSRHTLQPVNECGIVLALWVTPAMLDRLSQCNLVEHVVVLYVGTQGLSQWLERTQSLVVMPEKCGPALLAAAFPGAGKTVQITGKDKKRAYYPSGEWRRSTPSLSRVASGCGTDAALCYSGNIGYIVANPAGNLATGTELKVQNYAWRYGTAKHDTSSIYQGEPDARPVCGIEEAAA